MTVTKTIDKRKNYIPTFGALKVCDAFTSVGSDVVYIKTDILYDSDHRGPYNTVSLDGGIYWSEDDEEVVPIQEIEITIKK